MKLVMITKTKKRKALKKRHKVEEEWDSTATVLMGVETVQNLKQKMETLVEDLMCTKKCELVKKCLWFLGW